MNSQEINMKAFRVRGDGEVVRGLDWNGMDGVAYVPVGGTSRPYITVSPKLATASEREGRVFEVDYKVDGVGGMELVAPGDVSGSNRHDNALVVIPTGGFDFKIEPNGYVVNPRCGNACRVVELAPGEEISAFPKVSSHREALNAKPYVLRYDGTEVFFTVA